VFDHPYSTTWLVRIRNICNNMLSQAFLPSYRRISADLWMSLQAGVLCRCGNILEIDRVLLCRSGCTFRPLTFLLSQGEGAWCLVQLVVADHKWPWLTSPIFRRGLNWTVLAMTNKRSIPVDLEILGSGIKLRVIFFPTNVDQCLKRC
jgi:hypothetical protein